MRRVITPIALTILLVGILASCSDQANQQDAADYITRSEAYQSQGQFRAAMIEIRNAIQANPENPDFVIQYANLLIELGNANQAEEILRQHIDKIDAVRLPLAEALLMQGKFVSAQDFLKDWTPENADDASYFKRLQAIQLFMAGQKPQALNNFRALIDESDVDPNIIAEFISLLIQDGKFTEAEQRLQNALVKHPNEPKLLFLNAQLAYQNQELDVAEKKLTEALIYLPETDILLNQKIQVLELLSSVLTEQGRPDEALIYSKVIRNANPEAFLAKQQYKDALAAASSGDLNAAKVAFEDILAQFPNNQQAALLLGLINLEEGNLDAGEALLSENLNAETAPVSIIQATTLAQAEQGKPEEAIKVLEKALLARPDDVTLLSLLGIISLNNNQIQQGIKSISKAIQLDPSRTRLHLLLAQFYESQGDRELALGHLRKSYAQSPTDWATTAYYVTLLVKHEEIDEAKRIKNQILERNGADPAASWLVAMADYQLGNLPAALSRLEDLHKLHPNNINVISALAKVYQQQGQGELAAKMWLKAIEVNPGNNQFLQSLVLNLSRTMSLDQVIGWLTEKSTQFPELALPLNSAAVELLINQQRINEAKNIAKQYQGNDQPYGKSIQANILRGEAITLAQSKNWDEASKKAAAALAIEPSNTGLVLLNSRLERQRGNPDMAITLLKDGLLIQPGNAKLINELTIALIQAKSREEALNYIEVEWVKEPRGDIAQTYFALLRELKPDTLETAFKELLNAEPNNAMAYTNLAGLYFEKGSKSLAIENYKKALSINGNSVSALNNLAWLISDTNIAEALPYAERAAKLAPESASVLDTYGWLLYRAGDIDLARKILDRALEIAPDNQEIINHRNEIES